MKASSYYSCFQSAMFALLFVPYSSADEIRVVAITGQQSPGFPEGAVFSTFANAPTINSYGQVAFGGGAAGGGVRRFTDDEHWSDNVGVWSEGSGRLQLVARSGQAAHQDSEWPKLFETSLASDLPVLINGAGNVVFKSQVRNGNSLVPGLWTDVGGQLALISSGTGIVDYAINDSGYIRFLRQSTNRGGPGEFMEYSNHHGLVEVILPPTAAIRGLDNVTISSLGSEGHLGYGVNINDKGASVLNAGIKYDGGRFGAIVLNEAEGTPKVLLETLNLGLYDGQPREGILSLGNVGVNSNGHSAVFTVADLDPLIGPLNSELWSNRTGQWVREVKTGDLLPGMTDRVFAYVGDFEAPRINVDGKLAFVAGTVGEVKGQRRHVFSDASGQMLPIATEAENAPGTRSGELFRRFSRLVMNAQGQVAFMAQLQGAGIDTTNDFGVWAEDPLGRLKLIVRDGDMLRIGPNDVRRVNSFEFVGDSGNDDGRFSGFSDTGELAFRARFEDGTQAIIVSRLVVISEPPAEVLIGLLLGLPLISRTYAKYQTAARTRRAN